MPRSKGGRILRQGPRTPVDHADPNAGSVSNQERLLRFVLEKLVRYRHVEALCRQGPGLRILRINWADYPLRGALYECGYGEKALTHLCTKVLEKAEELFESSLEALEDDEIVRSANTDIHSYDPASFAEEYLNGIGSFGPVFKPAAWQDKRQLRRVFVIYPVEENPRHLDLDLSPRDGAFGIASVIAGPGCADEDSYRVRSALNREGSYSTSLSRLA